MRHRKARGRLGRSKGAREACLRNIVSSLFTFERVTTTLAKAKEARRLAEKLITLAKAGSISAQRRVASLLGNNRSLTHKLFKQIAPRFKSRQGGYTRILRLLRRPGDNAPLVILELTEKGEDKKQPKVTKKEEAEPEPKEEKKVEAQTKKTVPGKREAKVVEKKPPKTKFFRRIFKRERDSL